MKNHAKGDLKTLPGINFYRVDENPLEYSRLPFSALSTYGKPNFITCDYLSYGDYDNSCLVERSNFRLFVEQFKDHKGIVQLHGGWGSTGIGIFTQYVSKEVMEIISGFANYPCIDNDDLSNLEREVEDEVWQDFYRKDLIRELEKRLPELTLEQDAKLETYFESIPAIFWEDLDINFIHESGGNCYLDLDEATRKLLPVIAELLGLVETPGLYQLFHRHYKRHYAVPCYRQATHWLDRIIAEQNAYYGDNGQTIKAMADICEAVSESDELG